MITTGRDCGKITSLVNAMTLQAPRRVVAHFCFPNGRTNTIVKLMTTFFGKGLVGQKLERYLMYDYSVPTLTMPKVHHKIICIHFIMLKFPE